ncbi:MAG TPA: hypothetical protein VGS22_01725 [Thermoanaerobaculia bacterium]|jgi:hypothetical protein|nr:hypothetical protein [Thermoanaerobaculia bacterium]
MTRDEYEERKRRIEAHHRFSTELIDAARQQELRALELVWMTTAEGSFGRSLPPMPSEEATLPSASSASPGKGAPPAKARRRSLWEIVDKVVEVLPGLPDPFDRNDVCQALGYELDRGTLFRMFERLVDERRVKRVTRGEGRIPSQYRRVESEAAAVVE